MSNKETAVEWLVNEIESKNGKYFTSYFIEFIDQAKEIEKQQIIDALHYFGIENAEQYYTETFKNK